MARSDPQGRHGRTTGYRAHIRAGETPCTPCAEAQRAYDARRHATPAAVQASRTRAAAQHLALATLRRAHPDEYAHYYRVNLAALIAADDGGEAA